ncbi:MAG TPA: hypothetical protein VJM10_00310 [Candidatus Methylomirabilis sp.]|nr:hypothetical protein [Candidatus Methylomirabilis sp.]
MFKRLSMDKRQLTVELEEPLLIPLEWLARAVAISLLGRYPVLAEVVVRSKDAETRVSREEADELARPSGGLDTVTREECWGPWLTRFVRRVQDADRPI